VRGLVQDTVTALPPVLYRCKTVLILRGCHRIKCHGITSGGCPQPKLWSCCMTAKWAVQDTVAALPPLLYRCESVLILRECHRIKRHGITSGGCPQPKLWSCCMTSKWAVLPSRLHKGAGYMFNNLLYSV
jgi:hypothetical protein